MLILSGLKPVLKGSIRDVYCHPDDPRLLVKVIRRATLDEKFGSGRPWYKVNRRYGHLVSYLREVREHIALHVNAGEHPPYLQKIVGFAETDLGLGLVVEAIFDPAGGYAPTLGQLARKGRLNSEARAALDRFLDQISQSSVILADFHPGNIVYGAPGGGQQRFVLIDGIGFKTLVPLPRMSQRINAWNTRKRIERLRAKLARMTHKAESHERTARNRARANVPSH